MSVGVFAAFLATAAACAEGTSPSAGAGPLPQWTLSTEPLTVIGYAEHPSHNLTSVRGSLLLPSAIAIADGATGEIRMFAMDGTPQRIYGGKGGGPGEFMRLSEIAHGPNGEICAWGIQVVRLTCFSGGEVQRETSVDLSDATQLRPGFVGLFDDGSIVLRDGPDISSMRHEPEGERRDPIRYLRYDSLGVFRGIIASAPGRETYFYNGTTFWSNSQILFGRTTVDHMHGDRLLLATNDSLELRLYDPTGIVVRHAARAASLKDADARAIDRLKDERLRELVAEASAVRIDGASADRLARGQRELIERLPHRPTVPAFDAVVVSHEGQVWLGATGLPDAPTREWTILSETFETIARIALPGQATILDISGDRILLLQRDELDVESVRLYQIVVEPMSHLPEAP